MTVMVHPMFENSQELQPSRLETDEMSPEEILACGYAEPGEHLHWHSM